MKLSKLSILIILTVTIFCTPNYAELCKKCEQMMVIGSIGKCTNCGGKTSSGAYKLCKKCSKKLNKCQLCMANLPAKKKLSMQTINLNAKNTGKTIKAKLNTNITISLQGNITTGYSWFKTNQNGDAITETNPLKYKTQKHDKHLVGAGGNFTNIYSSKKIGKTTITYQYKRPWEKNKKPAKTYTITIEVVKELPKTEKELPKTVKELPKTEKQQLKQKKSK